MSANRDQRLAMTDTTDTVIAFRSLAEWQQHLRQYAGDYHRQDQLIAELSTRADRNYPASCRLCAGPQAFVLPPVGAYGSVDFRENLVCPSCHLNARMRAAFSLLEEAGLADNATVYLTEQASYAYLWLKRRHPGTYGSEYGLDPTRRAHLEHWLQALGAPGPIVHGDIMALRFGGASLDAIVSFDVLEHVPDYRAALAEFARCLKPDGVLLLTAPFLDDGESTLVRARQRQDGSIEHLLPPEIHGDPISGGALCFSVFGWDLLQDLRAAGFADAAWCRSWQPQAATLGLWSLRARR